MTRTLDIATLRAAIVAHPWRSLGLAVVAGGWLARVEPRSRAGRVAASVLGAVAATVLEDVAKRRLVAHAKSWIDERLPRYPPVPPS
jgi:hypothetical protein